MAIRKTWWGNHNGQEVFIFHISNGYMELAVSNFGGTVVSVMVPSAKGGQVNLVLGYDSLEGYINDPYYMGCIVGRFANRISNAAFMIGEKEYRLAANEDNTGNHLHGGTIGFNKKVFTIVDNPFQKEDDTVRFHYSSPNGEEGFPGNLELYVSYQLTYKNEVVINYKASVDQATPVNLTSHCYFNLPGHANKAITQEVFINANNVLASDQNHIPTGEIKPVHNTQFDFTKFRAIDIMFPGGGYNDCFVLNKANSNLDIQAALADPVSGRTMRVTTTLPGLMFYTGDHLGAPFEKNQGVCLEAQFFPDSPNQPQFPSALLQPGELYQHTTIYQFNQFHP